MKRIIQFITRMQDYFVKISRINFDEFRANYFFMTKMSYKIPSFNEFQNFNKFKIKFETTITIIL